MKRINQWLLIVVAIILVSCVDEYKSDFLPDKPSSLIMPEFLNQYDVLKSYIDRNASPVFKLGTSIETTDFLNQKTLYSLSISNFDEITVRNAMYHGSIVGNEGTTNFGNAMSSIEIAKRNDLSIYGQALVWHAKQNDVYLESLIAPLIIPEQIIPPEVSSGTTLLFDFESDNIGNTYPMSNANGVATVAADPKGQSGKALHIYGNDGPDGAGANQSFPVFNVVLPEGRKLGDYINVKLDMHINDNKGIYGQGMMLGINGKEATYNSPSGFGCPNNNWGRGLISLPVANLNLTDADKELTEFALTVGSRTGGGNYYIDNVIMEWETDNNKPTIIPEQIIEKTPEEKAAILTDALESWIKGMMEACEGYVKAWDVINEPMNDTNPNELKTDPNPQTNPKEPVIDTYFYWQDYLGKDYARIAIRLARQHGGNDLKLFVNDYGLEANPDKCNGLIQMIQYWESDGATKIDGIGTQMHVTYSLDAGKQAENETGVVNMFNLLAATGKLIRISELDMRIADANGAMLNAVNITLEQQTAMSEYYNFIVRKYFEIIPATQRYGITHCNSVESTSNVGLWTGAYNRKMTYSGFADGLGGK